MQDSFFHAAAPSPPNFPPNNGLPALQFDQSPIFDMSTPPYLRELPRPRFDADQVTSSLNSLFEDLPIAPATTRPSFSGQSPRLIDLLLPGSELNARPGTVTLPPMSMPTPAMGMSPMMEQFPLPMEMTHESTLEDDIEEILNRGESRTKELNAKYEKLGIRSEERV